MESLLKSQSHTHCKVNFALTFADILQPKIIKPNVTHSNHSNAFTGQNSAQFCGWAGAGWIEEVEGAHFVWLFNFFAGYVT